MKKILATNYAAAGTDLAALLLRLVLGTLMMVSHGFPKLMNYHTVSGKFMDFMGLGASVSLGLAIFAEFFCSAALVLGLFTRLALVPLIVTGFVIVFIAHEGDIFGKAEHGLLFLTGYLVLMITGAGRYSIDRLIARR